VLDRRLAQSPYVGGTEYSVADMATYPWIVPWQAQRQNLADFPHLARWFEAVAARPATVRAYARAAEFKRPEAMSEEAKRILFGQTAASVAERTRDA